MTAASATGSTGSTPAAASSSSSPSSTSTRRSDGSSSSPASPSSSTCEYHPRRSTEAGQCILFVYKVPIVLSFLLLSKFGTIIVIAQNIYFFSRILYIVLFIPRTMLCVRTRSFFNILVNLIIVKKLPV